MTKENVKSPDDPRRAEPPRSAWQSQPFDLREVLRKARAEALGALAPNSF